MSDPAVKKRLNNARPKVTAIFILAGYEVYPFEAGPLPQAQVPLQGSGRLPALIIRRQDVR